MRCLSFKIILVAILMLPMAGMYGCLPDDYGDGRVSCSVFPQTYTLYNGKVELVVAPQIGRVIGYREIGKPNMIWLNRGPQPFVTGNEWNDYGGEKIWLAPQGLWQEILGRTWPPETTIDGAPWNVISVSANKLIMMSRNSSAHAARVTRTISLPDEDTTVRMDYHLERTSDNPHPVQIWTITQVHLPDSAFLSLDDSTPRKAVVLENSFAGVSLEDNNNIGFASFKWPNDASTKVGTYGQWAAAIYSDNVFVQYASLNKNAVYYDNANCEIYTNPRFKYTELELFSPTVYLKAGESMDFTVTWKLLSRPEGADAESIVRMIQASDPNYKSLYTK